MTTDQNATTLLLRRIQEALTAATTAIQDDDDPANLPGDVSEYFYDLIHEINDVLSARIEPQSSDTDRNTADLIMQLQGESDRQRQRAEAAEHVIAEAAIRPGLDYPCRCDQCRKVASEMAEAGYLQGVTIPYRWFEQPAQSSDTDRNPAPDPAPERPRS